MNLFKRCSPYRVNFIFVLAFFTGHFAQSQSVGIGGEPNENAVLNITSGSKGLLIPRLSTAERNTVASPANGLMVYDTDLKCFFYYNDRQGWVDMKPTPTGMIVMWYGNIGSNFDADTGLGHGSMTGWALCDGKNGRPDLKNKFVIGYDGVSYNINDSLVGVASVGLSIDQMPSHSHSISDPGHAHGGSLINTSHSHTFPYSSPSGGHPDYAADASAGMETIYVGGNAVEIEGVTDITTFSATIQPASAGLSVNSTGAGTAHPNLPPYYVLAYIIKTQ